MYFLYIPKVNVLNDVTIRYNQLVINAFIAQYWLLLILFFHTKTLTAFVVQMSQLNRTPAFPHHACGKQSHPLPASHNQPPPNVVLFNRWGGRSFHSNMSHWNTPCWSLNRCYTNCNFVWIALHVNDCIVKLKKKKTISVQTKATYAFLLRPVFPFTSQPLMTHAGKKVFLINWCS